MKNGISVFLPDLNLRVLTLKRNHSVSFLGESVFICFAGQSFFSTWHLKSDSIQFIKVCCNGIMKKPKLLIFVIRLASR